METIGLDLENYYDKAISIKPLGVDGYLRHPDAKLYLISLYSEDADGTPVLEFAGPVDDRVPWDRIKGCHAIAHNARFDETDWLVNTLKKLIPEDCQPAKWTCSADLSVFMSGGRSLQGASKTLLQYSASKAYRGTALGKNWEDFNPDEQIEICEAGIQDAFLAFQLWKHFNIHWPEREQRLSKMNREMGRRGIAINKPLLEEAIVNMEKVLWEAGKTIPWEWGGTRSKTPMLKKEIAVECRKLNIPCPISFAEDSPDAQEWEETYGDTYEWIGALKTWRQGAGFLSKLKNIRDRAVVGTDNARGATREKAGPEFWVYPFSLKYFGAHTGRFSGGGGFNMQNIYRDERFGVMLRHVFIPRPGYKFLIVDYAQVEARILAWVCGMSSTLDLIRSGLSIYEVHAIQTMGWKAGTVSLKKADPEQYLLAKARVLALGYGCGAPKFQVMAFKLCGLVLDPITCKRTVDAFRRTNPEICRHWQKLHAEMGASTRKPSRRYCLELPSGRKLDYFDVNLSDGMKAKTERGGTPYHFYGGKLTENQIQAIGRDVMLDAKLACFDEVPQYPIVLDVHDELVFEVPIADATDETANNIARLMTDSSPWAEGLPLEVEWSYEDKYVK
jgi:hypothetical protein